MLNLFTEAWPWWLAAIGLTLVSSLLLLIEGRRLGVSSGLSVALGYGAQKNAACSDGPEATLPRWRAYFLLGLPLGGLLSALSTGEFHISLSMGSLSSLAGTPGLTAAVLFAGGLFIGWGTRQGGGCTSGHGIVGCALTRPSSLAATATFFAVAALVSNLVHLGAGVTP